MEYRHRSRSAVLCMLVLVASGCHDLDLEPREAVGSASLAAKGSPKTTVSITSPAGGATVSGVVSFNATASSSAGIAHVDFYIDGALAFHDTSSPFGFPWDTSLTANGTHTLLAEATPSSGNPSTAQISVTVSNAAPPPPPPPPPPPGEGVQVRMASFNIENFGESKASKPAVMNVLVDIALRYDLLLVQELTNVPDREDNTGPVIRQFLNELNAASGGQYAMVISPRVGDAQPEQYVTIYRTHVVSVLESFQYADSSNAFIREPAITRVQVGDEDFYITNVHTAPDFAESEIYAQTDVAHAIDGVDPDIVLLGDWNADGTYFSESLDWPGFALLGEGYENRIDDSWDTTVLSTNYTYDRIMLSPSLLDNDIPGSAAPFYFDDPVSGGWDMTPILVEGCSLGYLPCDATYQDAARRVSDHYPVEITLQFGGTITPPPPPPPPPPPAYATSFEDGEPLFEKVSGAGTLYPDTCPPGTTPRTGAAGMSNSSITTSYSGRVIQSAECIAVTGTEVNASYWITASTNNGGNNLRARVSFAWFTDAACTTAHATSQTNGAGVNVSVGSYTQVGAIGSPPAAAAAFFKLRAEVIDDNAGTNTNDDWCIDDVVVSQ